MKVYETEDIFQDSVLDSYTAEERLHLYDCITIIQYRLIKGVTKSPEYYRNLVKSIQVTIDTHYSTNEYSEMKLIAQNQQEELLEFADNIECGAMLNGEELP